MTNKEILRVVSTTLVKVMDVYYSFFIFFSLPLTLFFNFIFFCLFLCLFHDSTYFMYFILFLEKS